MSSTYLKPFTNRILVKPEKPKDKSDGGILLPDVAQKKTNRGRVLEMGGFCTDTGDPLEYPVKIGDVVVFDRFAGHPVEDDGVEYLILRPEDVLASVKH